MIKYLEEKVEAAGEAASKKLRAARAAHGAELARACDERDEALRAVQRLKSFSAAKLKDLSEQLEAAETRADEAVRRADGEGGGEVDGGGAQGGAAGGDGDDCAAGGSEGGAEGGAARGESDASVAASASDAASARRAEATGSTRLDLRAAQMISMSRLMAESAEYTQKLERRLRRSEGRAEGAVRELDETRRDLAEMRRDLAEMRGAHAAMVDESAKHEAAAADAMARASALDARRLELEASLKASVRVTTPARGRGRLLAAAMPCTLGVAELSRRGWQPMGRRCRTRTGPRR